MTTQTLELVPLAGADLAVISRWLADEQILIPYLLSPEPVGADDLRAMAELATEDDDVACWTLRLGNDLVGMANWRRDPMFRDVVEVEVTLGSGIPRGRGLGTEAHRVVIQAAFDQMGARKVVGRVAGFNTAMRQVLAKLGVEQEGLLRRHVAVNGEYVDLLLFGVLKDEWRW